jgi:twitching motility protein PilI
MSRRFNLRQFQTDLSKRLQEAASLPAESSRLGFFAAGQNWLVPLSDIDEVMPVPDIMAVPGTKSWFRGLANIRGNLYAVSDFTEFISGKPTLDSAENRLILAHRKHGVNAALLVQKSLGLKQTGHQATSTADSAWPWAKPQAMDSGESHWNEIQMDRLLAESSFLTVEAD